MQKYLLSLMHNALQLYKLTYIYITNNLTLLNEDIDEIK